MTELNDISLKNTILEPLFKKANFDSYKDELRTQVQALQPDSDGKRLEDSIKNFARRTVHFHRIFKFKFENFQKFESLSPMTILIKSCYEQDSASVWRKSKTKRELEGFNRSCAGRAQAWLKTMVKIDFNCEAELNSIFLMTIISLKLVSNFVSFIFLYLNLWF